MKLQFLLFIKDSNTTLVKVKCNKKPKSFHTLSYSNTTLVKVKFMYLWCNKNQRYIQIQLLLKLNNN